MTDYPPPPPSPEQPPFLSQPPAEPALDAAAEDAAEDVVAASPSPSSAMGEPPWMGLASGTGLALIAVAALTFLGVVAQGFAVEQDTSIWYRLGIAFLRNLDASPIGIMLIVGVALVAVPIIAGQTELTRPERQTSIALGLAAAIAVLVAVGAVLGVVTRLHFDTGPGQAITTVTRRVLATYIVRNLGPALVAFGATLAVVRLRSPRSVTPAP